MYQSTRSSYSVSDTSAVLQGIAPDGGLFVDPGIAQRPFDVRECMGLSYTEMAEKILAHLLPGLQGGSPTLYASIRRSLTRLTLPL